jgi:hypothetical protein
MVIRLSSMAAALIAHQPRRRGRKNGGARLAKLAAIGA